MIAPVTRQARLATALAFLSVLASCSADGPAASRCTVSSVRVDPSGVSVAPGATLALTATPTAQGCAASALTPTWSSSDVSVAQVSATGAVTALAPGLATVRATILGVAGTTDVAVVAPVASVVVTPAAATLAPGATLQLSAATLDAQGGTLTGRNVTWSASNATLATVSPTGLVTAVATGGPVTITATSEQRSGVASITIVPPPSIQLSSAAVAFTAVAGGANPAVRSVIITNGGGGALAGLTAGPVSYTGAATGWLQATLPSSSAAPTATLLLQPLIATLAPGAYSASVPVSAPAASNSPQLVTVTLTVQATPPAAVVVTPATFLLALGAKQAMTVVVRDAVGAIITGRTVLWSSSNPAVAAVDPATGLVTAASIGVASIVATVDGVSGNAFVYTGTTSAFDGSWRGSAGSGRTFAMTVSLGRVVAVTIALGTPIGSPCALSYTASPLTLISGNAFSFTTSGGTASATVGGSFQSTQSAQGTYGTVTFDRYLCPPNLLVTGTVPGGSWTAAKQ